MPQFKVYAAEVARMGDVAVIITTAYTNPGGYPRAEYFLIIPDEKCSVYANLFSFDVKSFEDSPIKLNEELMLDEALNQARIDLRLHLAKLSDPRGIVLSHKAPEVLEDNRNLLVHLWIRGQCAQRLVDVAKKTDFEPLRGFLKLIVNLPTIQKHGL